MMRLLWKEWHERAIWLLLWAMAVVIAAVQGHGLSPFGYTDMPSGWRIWCIVPALLAGLTAYGSELTGGRVSFLYTRALNWEQVLLAKVLPGLLVALGAPFLATIIIYLLAPTPYLPFITPMSLLSGAWAVIMPTSLAYLVGLSCSVVLPGLAGSILVLLGYAGISLLILPFLGQAHWYIVPTASLIAAILIVRFGVTLSPATRLRRFAPALLLSLGAGMLLAILLRQGHSTADRYIVTSVSPSSDTALVARTKNHTLRYYWMKLGEQRIIPLPSRLYIPLNWVTNDCLLLKNNEDGDIALLWWYGGQLHSDDHFLSSSAENNTQFYLSPDGRRLLIAPISGLEVFDLQNGQRKLLTDNGYMSCWWQSAVVVGYLKPGDERPQLASVDM